MSSNLILPADEVCLIFGFGGFVFFLVLSCFWKMAH